MASLYSRIPYNRGDARIRIDEHLGRVAVASWKKSASLNAADAYKLRRRAGEITAERSQIVFDMSNVEFVYDSIVRALVG